MLKNSSGDLVNQLQEKIKKMSQDHAQQLAEMEQRQKDDKDSMNLQFGQEKTELINDYEARLAALEA